MSEYVSLEGPLELVQGELALRIPLSVGGDQLRDVSKGIGRLEGEYWVVVIKPWLAEKLRVKAGSLIVVDNAGGKFNLTRSAANDAPSTGAQATPGPRAPSQGAGTTPAGGSTFTARGPDAVR